MKKQLVLLLMALLSNMASAQCPDGNHPHMIDLGLPSGTKWACCNVGADTPEGYGNYYAWGETQPKEVYSWETYIHCDGSWETCHDIGTNIAGTQYDVAHVKWGGVWVLPSEEQMMELIDNCPSEWATQNDVNGRLFSSSNGATLFLPATDQTQPGNQGMYWSSSLEESSPNQAEGISFFTTWGVGYISADRFYGFSVRPVATPAVSEPYAVLSSDGQTVTFYYDDQKANRGGIDINNSNIYSGSSSPYGTATTAVFDTSFASYRPESTAYWFIRCGSLTTITGIENLKTDNVTNMQYMFFGCSGLTSLDVSGFNTSNVTNMGNLFHGCSGLTNLDVSGFNTSNVTDMGWMFGMCSGLTSLDVSGFNTSNVTETGYMFCGCSGLTSLDVSGFDTSNVWQMLGMFRDCSSLTSLDLNGFDTSNVTDMRQMFLNSPSLTIIYAGDNWSTANVTDSEYMFTGCASLVGGNGTVFDANHTDAEYARIDKPGQPGYFTQKGGGEPEPYAVLSEGNTVLTFYYDDQKAARGGIDINNSYTNNSPYGTATTAVFDASFASYRPESTAYWFWLCGSLTTISGIENLKTDNVTNMRNMFADCNRLRSLDLSGINTSNVTNMTGMFAGCHDLTSLDLSDFDTSNVTMMDGMFDDCLSLTSLDLSGFNTSNVTDMSYMFAFSSGFTSLDLSGFNTSNVTNMQGMFAECTGLTSIDMSGFNTSNVTDIYGMFYDCSSLMTVYVGDDWSIGSITNGNDVFKNCTSLVGGNGTVYDENHTDAEYARIDKPGQPGYFTQKAPELEPIDNADFSSDIDEETDLDGNVVGDIYYNISSGDGSYDPSEGCIVVTTPTDDSVIDGQDIFGEDFQAGFTGIVFMVPEGKGTIKVEAETTGTMVLKVKIGNNDPIEMELEGRLKVSFPYNVTEPTYVYIYGGTASAAPDMAGSAAATGELRLYGVEVVKGETGIRSLSPTLSQGEGAWYSLDGRMLQGKPKQKGVYIMNGKKVVIK